MAVKSSVGGVGWQYEVPVLAQDMPREETMHIIANALETLNAVAADISNKVTTRVDACQTRMRAICDRIDASAAKVDSLKGSKRATSVFAPAKYNIDTDTFKPYQPLFSGFGQKITLKPPPKGSSKPLSFDSRVTLKEKQLYYNVRLVDKPKEPPSEGLGDPPRNMNFISNYLLFNTSQNLYRKQGLQRPGDRKGDQRRRKPVTLEDLDTGLGVAPASITQNEFGESQPDPYAYTPGLGDVPEFDVPDLLPDLPGIADLSYSAELPSIAPSLPVIEGLPEIIPDMLTGGGFEAVGSVAPTSAPGMPPAPPPPPPPPPPDFAQPSPPPPPPGQNIPPPPPPPPMGVVPPSSSAGEAKSKPEPVLSPSGDSHSSLMDSIRKAGGIERFQFRSAEEQKRIRKQEKERARETGADAEEVSGSKSLPAGGDLLADLSKALLLRRRGIAGKHKEQSESENEPAKPDLDSAMAKISNMIPPPRKETDLTDDEDDDAEDWDDDD